jgi:hypothetical protein
LAEGLPDLKDFNPIGLSMNNLPDDLPADFPLDLPSETEAAVVNNEPLPLTGELPDPFGEVDNPGNSFLGFESSSESNGVPSVIPLTHHDEDAAMLKADN